MGPSQMRVILVLAAFVLGSFCAMHRSFTQSYSAKKQIKSLKNREKLTKKFFQILDIESLKQSINSLGLTDEFESFRSQMILEQKKAQEVDSIHAPEKAVTGTTVKFESYHIPYSFPFFRHFGLFVDAIKETKDYKSIFPQMPEKIKYPSRATSHNQIVEQMARHFLNVLAKIGHSHLHLSKVYIFFLVSVGKYPCFISISRAIYREQFETSKITELLPMISRFASVDNFRSIIKGIDEKDRREILWNPDFKTCFSRVPRETLRIMLEEFGIVQSLESCFNLLSLKESLAVYDNSFDSIIDKRLAEFTGVKFAKMADIAFSTQLTIDMAAYLRNLNIEIPKGGISAEIVSRFITRNDETFAEIVVIPQNTRFSFKPASLALSSSFHGSFLSFHSRVPSTMKDSNQFDGIERKIIHLSPPING